MTLVIDHVVLAVRDLEDAGERMLRDHGLVFVPGGRHARWGTANRVVPLGDDYLELIGVVDSEQAAGSVFGRNMLDLTADGDRWYAICLASDDVDAIAADSRLPVEPGARTRPDGAELRWRGAGLDVSRARPVAPVLHHLGARRRSSIRAGRRRAPERGERASPGSRWAATRQRLSEWLGGADLPIRVVDEEPGLRAVALRTSDGAGPDPCSR